MIEKIQNELAKIIATEIYDQAKKTGKDVYKGIKNTNLTKRGSGLPNAVLSAFEELFIETLNGMTWDHYMNGYTIWRHKNIDQKLFFLSSSSLIDIVSKGDWVAAAQQTNEGVKQIEAFGDAAQYQAAVSSAITPTFIYAVKKMVGLYHKSDYLTGWRILSPVICKGVAAENSSDFEEQNLFYWSHGTESKTASDYKIAKDFVHSGWFKKPTQPTAGPYTYIV